MPESPVLHLARDLLSRRSITPADAGCQDVMIKRLEALGFTVELMIFEDTTNFWARRGTEAPLFTFAGHTDVVPTGSLTDWDTDPFTPTIVNDMLYARGAADMKGSLACMIVAVERFVTEYPDHKGSLSFLITSDEEGPFINGTTRVIDTLKARNEIIDMCIVGEPSSSEYVGDVIKNGRRGSLSGNLTIKGIQGHVAYPQLAKNPIHQAMPALSELVEQQWDNGNAFFPPTTFQIPNINGGTGASNVIPKEITVMFNFRFNTESNVDSLKQKVNSILERHKLDYDIEWQLSGLPFLTDTGSLLKAVTDAIKDINHIPPQLSTSGGTSDGRFIATMGAEVIELGPLNATIHQVNECVNIQDLEKLTDMYQKTLINLLS